MPVCQMDIPSISRNILLAVRLRQVKKTKTKKRSKERTILEREAFLKWTKSFKLANNVCSSCTGFPLLLEKHFPWPLKSSHTNTHQNRSQNLWQLRQFCFDFSSSICICRKQHLIVLCVYICSSVSVNVSVSVSLYLQRISWPAIQFMFTRVFILLRF